MPSTISLVEYDLPSISTVIVPVASSGTATSITSSSPTSMSFPVALTAEGSLWTVNLLVVVLFEYLTSPEYFTITVLSPAVNPSTSNIALPSIISVVEYDLPSISMVIVPVAPFGTVTTTVSVSPT